MEVDRACRYDPIESPYLQDQTTGAFHRPITRLPHLQDQGRTKSSAKSSHCPIAKCGLWPDPRLWRRS